MSNVKRADWQSVDKEARVSDIAGYTTFPINGNTTGLTPTTLDDGQFNACDHPAFELTSFLSSYDASWNSTRHENPRNHGYRE